MVILVFIFGLCLGSFLNVIIDRLPRGESFLFGRSHCDNCLHILAWYDLIPLLSFVSTKGACRYCHVFTGYKYPLVELLTASFFSYLVIFFVPNLVIANVQNLILLMVTSVIIASGLIIVFFADILYGIIPDSIVITIFIASGVYLFFSSQLTISHVFGSVISGAAFLFLFLITKGKGMGLGDVKFAFFIGFFLGIPQFGIALYIAFLTGAIVSLILIVVHKKKLRGSTIAFGPFLVIGTVSSWLFGNILLQLVSHFLYV